MRNSADSPKIDTKFNVNAVFMFLVHIGSYSWIGKRESTISLSQKIYLSKEKYSMVQRWYFRTGHDLESSVLQYLFLDALASLKTMFQIKLVSH